MKTWATRGWAALATATLLAIAPSVRADQGNAVIDAKEPGQLVLSGRPFRLSDSTVLESKEGNHLSLAELPTKADGASDDASAVFYEASDDERAPLLHRVRLTGGVPD